MGQDSKSQKVAERFANNFRTMPPQPMSPHDNTPDDQKHGVDVFAASKAYDGLDALEHRFDGSLKSAYQKVMSELKKIKSRR